MRDHSKRSDLQQQDRLFRILLKTLKWKEKEGRFRRSYFSGGEGMCGFCNKAQQGIKEYTEVLDSGIYV